MQKRYLSKSLLASVMVLGATTASAAPSSGAVDPVTEAMNKGAPVHIDLGSDQTQMNKSMLIDVVPTPPKDDAEEAARPRTKKK